MSEGVALWWMKVGLVYTFLSKFGRYDDAAGGIHRLSWLLAVESQHGITSLHHASLSAETPTPLLTLPLRYWSRTRAIHTRANACQLSSNIIPSVSNIAGSSTSSLDAAE